MPLIPNASITSAYLWLQAVATTGTQEARAETIPWNLDDTAIAQPPMSSLSSSGPFSSR